MANIVREELWWNPGLPAMIVVTTNATVRRDGALVMGRGAARQATEKIHGIEFECGFALKAYGATYGNLPYGFLVVRDPFRPGKAGFGIFQVKYHWGEPANLNLIALAASTLAEWAREHSDVQVRMNYPGIGNGRLSRRQVGPLLKHLPDNVTVCYR